MADSRLVDPRGLPVPSSRQQGANPAKLLRQISKYGVAATGMPARWVYETADGELILYS